MKKPAKLALATLALIPSALVLSIHVNPANALTPKAATSPKVVFIGDQVTANWPLTQTNPNWINQGKADASCETIAEDYLPAAIALHPNVIHIMAGEVDQLNEMGMGATYATGEFAGCIQYIVQQVKAANIQVVVGLEPQGGLNGSTEYITPTTMNVIEYAVSQQQGVTVI